MTDKSVQIAWSWIYYVPNYEEVEGAYLFRVVRACGHLLVRSSHFLVQSISYEPCMLGF